MAILNGDEFSDVVEIAKDERVRLLNKNNYNKQKEYNSSSPDVFSDGDNKGREDNGSGQIGTNIDIETRNKLLAKSRYNSSKPYKRPVD